jgi:acyl-coenzyme A thioesterase PaaI-like protein
MEINYLRPVHSATPIRIEGRLLRTEGRKYWTEAHIRDSRGRELARSTGLFIKIGGTHGF